MYIYPCFKLRRKFPFSSLILYPLFFSNLKHELLKVQCLIINGHSHVRIFKMVPCVSITVSTRSSPIF